MEKIWEANDIDCIVEMIQNENHQIVPVIGADVFYVKQGDEEILLYDFIFRQLVERFFEPEDQERVLRKCTGSQLRRMKELQKLLVRFGKQQRGKTPSLYSCVALLMKSPDIRKLIKLRDSVKDFLQYGNFPLIITTCYADLLEKLLIAPHGQRYQHVGYYCQATQDIQSPLIDSTIFHLFGISESGQEPMITEDDFLKYLHFLHYTSAPGNLKLYLQSRTVLALGCNIPDWAFRFILHSLMETGGRIGARTNLLGGAVKRDIEQEFEEFLEDIGFLSGDDIDLILKPLNDAIKRPSLFLSYSAKESTNEWDGIQTIRKKLEPYYTVWFFPEQSKKEYGEEYWELIRNGLKECDVFLAVVTQGMINQMNNVSSHGPVKDLDAGFLWEWKMMMDCQKEREKKALCLGYFLDSDMAVVQKIINNPNLPLSYSKPIFDDKQNITNTSPSEFDPEKISFLRN